jgi:hypothetical protein
MGRIKLKTPDYLWRRKHMRYVVVPEAVTLRDSNGQRMKERDPMVELVEGKPPVLREIEPVSLHRYLMIFIINETETEESRGNQPGRQIPKIGIGYEGDKRIAKLDRLFEKTEPGQVVAVEDADWQAVKHIIEKKLWVPKQIGGQLFPISEAWMEASERKPD